MRSCCKRIIRKMRTFKNEASELVESTITLEAFIGKEMIIDYSKGISKAIETAHGADRVLRPINYLRFSPDYNSTSLWLTGEKVGMIEYDRVGLSKELISELENFDEHVCGLIDWSDPGGPCPMPVSEQWELYNEGHRLYERVKEELGDCFVIEEDLDWIRPKEDC